MTGSSMNAVCFEVCLARFSWFLVSKSRIWNWCTLRFLSHPRRKITMVTETWWDFWSSLENSGPVPHCETSLRMATVMGLQQKIRCDSIRNLGRASYSLTAATTHVNWPTDLCASMLIHWSWYMFIVGCNSVCVIIVQSAHAKLHFVPKFVRFMSYGVASELTRLWKLHTIVQLVC